jgi:hypothetical protein
MNWCGQANSISWPINHMSEQWFVFLFSCSTSCRQPFGLAQPTFFLKVLQNDGLHIFSMVLVHSCDEPFLWSTVPNKLPFSASKKINTLLGRAWAEQSHGESWSVCDRKNLFFLFKSDLAEPGPGLDIPCSMEVGLDFFRRGAPAILEIWYAKLNNARTCLSRNS